MRRVLLALAAGIALLLTAPASAKEREPARGATGGACEGFQRADKDLNTTYQRIRSEYAGDALFLKKLEAAQRAWIGFRDAAVLSLHPVRDGSVATLCECTERERLTRARTRELQRWIEGIEEGDVCRGTIRMKSAGASPAFIPAEGMERVIADHFDVTTVRSSLGPKRVPGQRTFADLGIALTLAKSGKIEFDTEDWFYGITVLERADKNGDGLMDVVVCFVDKAKTGSYSTSAPYLLTRYDDDGPIIALAFTSENPACPRSPGER